MVPRTHPSTGPTKVKARGWKPSAPCPAATEVQAAAEGVGLVPGIGDGVAEDGTLVIPVVEGLADAVGTPLQAARPTANSATPLPHLAGVMEFAISLPTSLAVLE